MSDAMNVRLIFPLAVCIVGLVMFLVAKTNADVKAIGQWSFVVGLLVTLLVLSRYVVSLG